MEHDKIVGAICLGKTILWWTNKEIFTDLVFYVNPEFRTTDVPAKLLEYIKDFSNSTKMPIIISVLKEQGIDDVRLLQRYLSIKGFKNAGFSAIYSPKD